MEKNVLGKELAVCSCEPMTGWMRDGYCNTDYSDRGVHTVCGIMTEDFLSFSKESGNDLSTPRPESNFVGLKPGDHWCVCAGRWLEAFRADRACLVDLNSTHEESLAIIPLDALKSYSFNQ